MEPLPFPGGESKEECAARNLKGFEEVLEVLGNEGITEAALVVHGGTIMNIMETYALPEKAFYEWHVGNGCGYEVELEPEQWQKTAKKFQRVRKLIHHWNKNRGYDKNNSDGAVDSVAVCVYVQIQKYTKRF